MAEQQGYEIGAGAKMDYREHEKTYGLFLNLIKFGTIWVIAILLGMLVGLMAAGGFIGGVGTFLVFGIVATLLAR